MYLDIGHYRPTICFLTIIVLIIKIVIGVEMLVGVNTIQQRQSLTLLHHHCPDLEDVTQ